MQAKYQYNYTDEQLACELKISVKELHDFMAQINACTVVSLDEKISTQANFDVASTDLNVMPEQITQKNAMVEL